ncbi:hypothetical protein [Arthrobacter sp. MYb222]|uniref:mannitol dehydrogenase family protein n=1 Tax=Arthrobacter sp. MYb222 TaxID=1848599 RepID=UPI0015E44536|nr:hypothetical protein [Arthrobacter sp. MYb222]
MQAEIGFRDEMVVKAEHYYVWAIGGSPAIAELLPLDKAGLNVLFMDDIKAFRAKKVKILNGSHTAMSAIALQLGCCTVKEAFSTPLVDRLINQMVAQEVLPTIDGDRHELEAFTKQILERFYNPFLQHQLADIALNALSKWTTRNLPVVVDRWHSREEAPLTVFSFAALLVLYSGESENTGFQPRDDERIVEELRGTFERNNIPGWVTGTVEILSLPELLGEAAARRLAAETSRAVQLILGQGMGRAAREYLG